AGVITAAGLVDRADYVPVHDATVVARMREAGAILLGKTNCPEGGGGNFTNNDDYGQTNNPYDLARTPGGSSGGEAAIQAAGGSPVGIGSDSGGSIRVPAHLCGIAGLKPTSGRVPCTGGFELPGGLVDTRTQIGPMSRFVCDLGPTLAIIAGVDETDSAVVPMPLGDPSAVTLSELRLAFYTDDGLLAPTAETVATVQATAQVLAEAGLAVDERTPPVIRDARSITERYWHSDAPGVTGRDVLRLMLDWNRFRSSMLKFMGDYDLLLCPAAAGPAPLQGTPDEILSHYTLPFSLTGWPCVVVRAGTSPEGLPIGVQVAARPWREDVALAVALEIETALGGWKPPAL
ncbi:MAG: amidase, partial [Candidatus Binatia bacterium]